MLEVGLKMNKNIPKVSIIIPTMNREQSLERCLISLNKETFKNFEIVIVEGGDTNNTKKVIKNHKELKIKIIKQKEKGLVNAINEGILVSKGEIIVRTDDDIVADKEWINEIVKTFNESKKIGGVTGPTIIPENLKNKRDLFYFQKKLQNGNIFWHILGKIYFNYFLEGKEKSIGKFFRSGAFSVGSNYKENCKFKKSINVDHHEACNMAIRRHILIKIGYFDRKYLGIGDYSEADVSFKIIREGYKIIFNPKAVVKHLVDQNGVFANRSNSYERTLNFINFYFINIKLNTIDKSIRFFSYLIFLNLFLVYKFISTKQISYLKGIRGTIVGLTENLFKNPIRR